jgi:hypothetical protein
MIYFHIHLQYFFYLFYLFYLKLLLSKAYDPDIQNGYESEYLQLNSSRV